jgi:glycosyltransferase involved in cell wall biosynthesis
MFAMLPDPLQDGRERVAEGPRPLDDVWIVIPLYNEETVIGGVVEELLRSFTHVVCIDDGSSDDSAARAAAAGATVLHHAVNLGQGAALQTGIAYALRQRARYVVTFDADGQHRVEDALGMVELAEKEDLAVVFGSRFLDRRTNTGTLKRLVLRTAAWFTRQRTGMRLTDAHNGLRVIREDAARGVDLKQNRMAHASEIVLQLGRTRLPWKEYPVHVLYTEYSKAKGQSLWNAVNILVDLIFK